MLIQEDRAREQLSGLLDGKDEDAADASDGEGAFLVNAASRTVVEKRKPAVVRKRQERLKRLKADSVSAKEQKKLHSDVYRLVNKPILLQSFTMV